MVKSNSYTYLLVSGRRDGGVILHSTTPCGLILHYASTCGLFDPRTHDGKPLKKREHKPKIVKVYG